MNPRVEALRDLLKQKRLDALLVDNLTQSQYVLEVYQTISPGEARGVTLIEREAITFIADPLSLHLRWHVFDGAGTQGGLYNPPNTTSQWDGANQDHGVGRTPRFTIDDMPESNDEFGRKTVRIRLLAPNNANLVLYETTQGIEVFWPLLVDLAGNRDDANFAKNHPGPDLNSQANENNGNGPGERAPNWFFYWRQVVPNTDEARYAGTHIPGSFGRCPAVRWFPQGYNLRHDRLLIGEIAQRDDTVGGRTTGIDCFDDTVQHEQHHAMDQSVGYTNGAFGLGIGGATPVADNHWSFNIGKPAPPPAPPLPPGRVYNHYLDNNGDGDFLDGGEDVDLDGDDVFNAAEPGTVESLANNAEPNNQHGRARMDWGNPGKNHETVDDYSD